MSGHRNKAALEWKNRHFSEVSEVTRRIPGEPLIINYTRCPTLGVIAWNASDLPLGSMLQEDTLLSHEPDRRSTPPK